MPPQIFTSRTNVDAVEGDDAHFECEVTGHPIPIIFWFVNGAPVNELQEDFETSGNAKHMTIKNLQV